MSGITSAMDLTQPVKLLDHGYLRYVEHWGSDERIVEAARMSTQRSFVSWEPYKRCKRCDAIEFAGVRVDVPLCPGFAGHQWKVFHRGDLGILSYLWKNNHSTPFEMAGLTLEVQAPIVVFREWHRHRVPFGYSEASARYAPLPDLDYLPTVARCMRGGGHLTKQAGAVDGAAQLDERSADEWLRQLAEKQTDLEKHYQLGLKIGIPKELARGSMTVFRYSRMYVTANVRGWLAFLALRKPKTAQEEIRVYAETVDDVLCALFPRIRQVVDESLASR